MCNWIYVSDQPPTINGFYTVSIHRDDYLTEDVIGESYYYTDGEKAGTWEGHEYEHEGECVIYAWQCALEPAPCNAEAR